MVGSRGRLASDAVAVARRRHRRRRVRCDARPACWHRRRPVDGRLPRCGAGPIRSRRAPPRGPGRVPLRPTLSGRTQHRCARIRLDTRGVCRLGLDDLVRQSGVARAGLAAADPGDAVVLPGARHTLARPRRRPVGVDARADRRADAGARQPPSQRLPTPGPVDRSGRPGDRRRGLSHRVHGDGSHRVVRPAELVAEPPRSGRSRTRHRPDRHIRRRGSCSTTSSSRWAARRRRFLRDRGVRHRTSEVAGDVIAGRRPPLRTGRAHVRRRPPVCRVPGSTHVQPAERSSILESGGHCRARRPAGR